MNDDFAIQADRVSKKYCKSLKRSMIYGINDIAKNSVGMGSHSGKLRKDEFWAVDEVSFVVKKGETLGVIGPNGSGKTTLLKMLNGIFWPDRGKISIRGNMGALIEVGAGFHPLLTGRENIYINAAILGMTKSEVDEKFDSIVEFADIGDFINSPVKHYSSGMYVRLGFSVAVHCEPEILLVDEVLAVGDLAFQNKSLERLAKFREKANAVVFVSHNLEHIRNLCDKVIILDGGKTAFSGDTHEAILRYHEMSRKRRLAAARRGEGFELFGHVSSGDITFIRESVLDSRGEETDVIPFGSDIVLHFEFEVRKRMEELYFSVGIHDEKKNICIWEMSNDGGKKFLNSEPGNYILSVRYHGANLMPGIYMPTLAVRNARTGETYEKITSLNAFRIEGDLIPRGTVYAKSEWLLEKKT